MAQTSEPDFKQVLKAAVVEAIQEQRDLLREIFADVLEEFALAEAIPEGRETKLASREEVFSALKGKL